MPFPCTYNQERNRLNSYNNNEASEKTMKNFPGFGKAIFDQIIAVKTNYTVSIFFSKGFYLIPKEMIPHSDFYGLYLNFPKIFIINSHR